ncbi:hypothetical protein B484DRAFT_478887 [Ochromonadaceae sp. CCMP2298]|nr:hypothetical protein B484DRAFT_478887 [Ochromonadaceae sp. CCMP2298]
MSKLFDKAFNKLLQQEAIYVYFDELVREGLFGELNECMELATEVLRFLALRSLFSNVAPSMDVERGWLVLLKLPCFYARVCALLIKEGKTTIKHEANIIDYDPSPKNLSKHELCYLTLKSKYANIFSVCDRPELWPERGQEMAARRRVQCAGVQCKVEPDSMLAKRPSAEQGIAASKRPRALSGAEADAHSKGLRPSSDTPAAGNLDNSFLSGCTSGSNGSSKNSSAKEAEVEAEGEGEMETEGEGGVVAEGEVEGEVEGEAEVEFEGEDESALVVDLEAEVQVEVEGEGEVEAEVETQKQLLEAHELELKELEELEQQFENIETEHYDIRQQLLQLEEVRETVGQQWDEADEVCLFEDRQDLEQKLQQAKQEMDQVFQQIRLLKQYQRVEMWEIGEREEVENGFDSAFAKFREQINLQTHQEEQLQSQHSVARQLWAHSPLVSPTTSATAPVTVPGLSFSMDNTAASAGGNCGRSASENWARASAAGAGADASASAGADTGGDLSPSGYHFPEEWHFPCARAEKEFITKCRWVDLKQIYNFGFINGKGLLDFLRLRPDVQEALKKKQIQGRDIFREGRRGVHVFHTDEETVKYFIEHLTPLP